METVNSEITGIVLAGGQSRRMGFNKAEADVGGESMLIHAINKLQELTPTILVSSGSLTYPNIALTQIPDEIPNCGPLGGIYSVLKASNSSLNLIVSCDIPLVSVSLLKHMVNKAALNDALITVPMDQDGQVQMLCAVYHKDLLPILEQQINAKTYKMKALLDLVSVEYINISSEHPLYDESAFTNVNTFNALQEARELWKKHQE